MQFSNLFAALIVTLFSTESSTWSDLYLHAVNERKISIRKTYIKPKKLDKLDSFGIEYTIEQTLFKNLAIFDFESICVQE